MCGRHIDTPLFLSYFLSWLVKYIKKCFICEKVNCWSTNYTQQECEKLKKKFTDRYLKYKAQQDGKKALQYWITDYEGIKDDNNHIA